MRRSIWIFFASIFLPSLGLAWMAVRSAEDQQVVLEHQQVIICQNITDTLAQNIQSQMDQVRVDFVSATQQLLGASPSPQALAEDFNSRLHSAWPMASIGFAVNLDGEIYSPKPFDSPDARTFRTENDRFLSNRENAEIYSSISTGLAQNFKNSQNAFSPKKLSFGMTDLNAANTSNAANNATASLAFPSQSNAEPPGAADKQVAGSGQVQDLAKQVSVAGKYSEHQMAALQPEGQAAPTAMPAPTQTMNIVSTGGYRDSANSEDAALQKQLTVTKPPVLESAAQKSTLSGQMRAQASVSAGSISPSTIDALSQSASQNKVEHNVDADSVATASPTLNGPSSALTANAATTSAPPQADESSLMNTQTPAASTPIGGSLAISGSVSSNVNASNNSDQLTLNAQVIAKIPRQVVPQKGLTSDVEALSNTVPEESDFRRAIGSGTSGALARFLENKLRLMVWSHPDGTSIVFGAQLDTARLAETFTTALQIPELQPDSFSISRSAHSEYGVAILDDTGQPVAVSPAGFHGDWKHPFVATEIGEALPHWEAALYLIDPQRINRAARTLRYTLGLIVLVLVAAIVSGGSLVAADVRRQMRLAQQKTDFVSNVSHELKTPLTSIRMFADLLAEKRVPDEQRQSTYLRIISAEAARLTRLINNVLDFARLERGAPPGEHRDCDLVDAVRDVVETCGPHLEAAGIAFRHEIEADALPIRGDRDALAQIILNLVSNAEKYGGNDVLVRVRRQETSTGALACVDVLDRGPGIPAEKVRTVFEPFHRLDDSLSSGIPGSGLGLTLARRMARSHGGDVTYSPRAGGGSCFTLTVPLQSA